jgi:hypothetical protein
LAGDQAPPSFSAFGEFSPTLPFSFLIRS